MARAIDKYVCPLCGQKALFVGVHDDEGNYHGLVGCEYENDPWSGLSYALHHEGWGDCPLCTDGAYSAMGGMLFDTAEEAISALSPPNEWVSVEDAVPDPGVRVLAANGSFVGEAYMASNGAWMRHDGFPWKVDAWIPLPEPPDRRLPEGEA